MKNIFFFIFSIFIGTSAFAVETEGYYIAKNGDTIKGKIEIRIKPKPRNALFGGTIKPPFPDLLKDDVPNESEIIDYSSLAFDFKFSENGEKLKKIDRLKVKGFGFVYEGQHYNFETWDVTANKQIYLMSALGDVAPDGVYFILRSIDGALPIYSLFQEVDVWKKKGQTIEEKLQNKPQEATIFKERAGEATKRDIIFKHPTKGFIYISDKYPLIMKFSAALKYLEFEEEFVATLSKKDNLLDVVKKYNAWKSSK